MARFGKDRFKPNGDWVQTTLLEKVAGIHHHKPGVLAFCKAVRAAEARGETYGLHLKPDPDNDYDRFAIEVRGFATVQGWLGHRVDTWLLGFLPAELAEELHRDLLSRGIPLAAELYEIYQGDDGFIDVKLIVLAPPGSGHKARVGRRAG